MIQVVQARDDEFSAGGGKGDRKMQSNSENIFEINPEELFDRLDSNTKTKTKTHTEKSNLNPSSLN